MKPLSTNFSALLKLSEISFQIMLLFSSFFLELLLVFCPDLIVEFQKKKIVPVVDAGFIMQTSLR